MNTPLVLMDKQRISRSIKRMAYEIIEKNASNRPVVLFGIDQRGYAVAKLLDKILANISDKEVQTVQLSLTSDVTEETLDTWSSRDGDTKFMIVVDDVIFSGKTMFRALQEIADKLAPSEIHTAVMIDRGHRQFPIRAEFYGMELPTKVNEHVAVVVNEMHVEEVILEKR